MVDLSEEEWLGQCAPLAFKESLQLGCACTLYTNMPSASLNTPESVHQEPHPHWVMWLSTSQCHNGAKMSDTKYPTILLLILLKSFIMLGSLGSLIPPQEHLHPPSSWYSRSISNSLFTKQIIRSSWEGICLFPVPASASILKSYSLAWRLRGPVSSSQPTPELSTKVAVAA